MAAKAQPIENKRNKRIMIALFVLGAALLLAGIIALIILCPGAGVPAAAITIKGIASTVAVHTAHTAALLSTNKMALFVATTPAQAAVTSYTTQGLLIGGLAVGLLTSTCLCKEKFSNFIGKIYNRR